MVINLSLKLIEPLLDLAVMLLPKTPDVNVPSFPSFVKNVNEIKTGEEVLVVGYPFSPLGSILETVQICNVSALGIRQMGVSGRRELILSAQTYTGSSGSPVLRRTDGKVCGIIRGCLAPPGLLSIGNLPLGTDTNITYATSSQFIPSLIKNALEN
jgi:Trypsin-like peptidase domain